MPGPDDPFERFFAALEARHLGRAAFPDVRRALQALSSLYVERRGRLAARAGGGPGDGPALDGAGKRAAFALFYGALHFLAVREIVRALDAARPAPARVLDLGCGTGVAGAALALEAGAPRPPPVLGVDRSAWALGEARFTYRALGVPGRTLRRDAALVRLPGRRTAIVAAFALNELAAEPRARLLRRLLEAGRRGARILVVEPIARRPAPWWDGAAAAFRGAGGRADEWRFPADLPERLRLLDKAAGLDHRELTARSLWLPAATEASGARAPREEEEEEEE